MEGHEALRASDAGAADEDAGAVEVVDLSSSGKTTLLADPLTADVGTWK